MKSFILFRCLLLIVLSPVISVCQSVGINNPTPDSSAMLDVKSTTKGLLIPRMTTVQRTAITTPAIGLQVFDTDTKTFWFYSGTIWSQLSAGNNGWNLTGNTGTATTNFIGTTDAQPLKFRINNINAGIIDSVSANTAIGFRTLDFVTTGTYNVALGYNALYNNTTGSENTAIGVEALFSNTTGSENNANGRVALYSNTTGIGNTANGYSALGLNTTGNYNTANGRGALISNTTGSENTANGYQALFSNTTASRNTANGLQALFNNTTGTTNTANGYKALFTNNTGLGNTANGYQALHKNTDGFLNTAIGREALYSNTTASENTAIGVDALYNQSFSNSNNAWVSGNTAIGYSALYSNQPTAILSGIDNTAIGRFSLNNNTTGVSNTAVGSLSLAFNNTGGNNTATGYQALYRNTGSINNTATGVNALYSNTIGINNTAIGAEALRSNTGSYNTAIGINALFNIIAGSNNIAIGHDAGTAPGFTNLFNTIGIGNDGAYLHGASNQVLIGNTSTLFIGGKVNWTALSDARVKNNVKEDVKGLDFIMKLRPVTYNISNAAINAISKNKDTLNFPGKYDGEKIKYTGFLAQEVEQAAKAVNYEFSGYDVPKNEFGFYGLRYAEFVVPLVKAMQEQQAIIEKLKREIELLKKKNNATNKN
ncbi:MAG: tail fiber domain-containing protein [Chitinophagaceae bacterium]